MTPPENLLTDRLRLRKPVLEDAEFVFTYGQDEEVARYMLWKKHECIDDSRQFLERCIRVWEENTAFPWLIEKKEQGSPLGMIEISIKAHMVNVGYVLSRPYWGRGYMTEAVSTVRDWAMAQPQIFRFWAYGDVDNHGSRRVMEKAGMQFEGVLRRWMIHPNVSDEPRDAFCYAIVR